MDGERFDRIAISFADGVSRRGVVRVLTVSLAPLAGSMVGLRRAAAAPDYASAVDVAGEATDGKCHGKAAVNNHHCAAHGCSSNGVCICQKTINGNKQCVNPRGVSCPKKDECNHNKDCPPDSICAKVGGCCGHPKRNLCVPLCG